MENLIHTHFRGPSITQQSHRSFINTASKFHLQFCYFSSKIL
uniref:Uncharacterized protein n=1 Tax=Phlebotomus papatasi TaxID=29031 RepID=A0A1B0DF72_PHLPP